MKTQQPPIQPIVRIQQQKKEDLSDLMRQLKSSDNDLKLVASKQFSDLENKVLIFTNRVESLETNYPITMDIILSTQERIDTIKKDLFIVTEKLNQQTIQQTITSSKIIKPDHQKEQQSLQKYNEIINDIENNINKQSNIKATVNDFIEYKKSTETFTLNTNQAITELQTQLQKAQQINQSHTEKLHQHQKAVNRLYVLSIFSLGTSLGLLLYAWYYTHE